MVPKRRFIGIDLLLGTILTGLKILDQNGCTMGRWGQESVDVKAVIRIATALQLRQEIKIIYVRFFVKTRTMLQGAEAVKRA